MNWLKIRNSDWYDIVLDFLIAIGYISFMALIYFVFTAFFERRIF